jgi:ribosomal protein S8
MPKLTEFIDLTKSFEKKASKNKYDILSNIKDKDYIKSWQLERYFGLEDIKINKKKDGSAEINVLYKHKKSKEIINILWEIIKSEEMGIYKMFTNEEFIKHIVGTEKMPHDVDGIEQKYTSWKFEKVG